MVSVNKVMIVILMGWIIPASVSAKCANISRQDYFNNTNTFVKGSVSEVIEQNINSSGKDVTLKVKVLLVLKGDVKSDTLDLKYKWMNVKEPFKTFEKDKIYIFGIDKNKKNLVLRTSTCDPDLTESEINEFKSMK